MNSPIRVVNNVASAESGGLVIVPATTAGNLIVVILGFPGSASASGDTLIEAIAGSNASIWYCVSNGGTTSISFASAGPGMWFFELSALPQAWALIDQQHATGFFTPTNIFSLHLASDCSVESAASLTGDLSNCCYFTVLDGILIGDTGLFNQAIYSLGWKLHPQRFGILSDFSTSLDHIVSTALLLNGSGPQQFQFWFYGDYAGYEHDTIGAVFSSTGGSTVVSGADVNQFLPNVWIVS